MTSSFPCGSRPSLRFIGVYILRAAGDAAVGSGVVVLAGEKTAEAESSPSRRASTPGQRSRGGILWHSVVGKFCSFQLLRPLNAASRRDDTVYTVFDRLLIHASALKA